jgi:hypothetical protein
MNELRGLWYVWAAPLLSAFFIMLVVYRLCPIMLLAQIAGSMAYFLVTTIGLRKL